MIYGYTLKEKEKRNKLLFECWKLTPRPTKMDLAKVFNLSHQRVGEIIKNEEKKNDEKTT